MLRGPGPASQIDGGAPVLGWAPWEKAASCGCCGRALTLFLLLRPHFPSMLLAGWPSTGVGTFMWRPFLPEENLWDRRTCPGVRHLSPGPSGRGGLTSMADPGDISPYGLGPCSSALAHMHAILQRAVVADVLLDSSEWDNGDWALQ